MGFKYFVSGWCKKVGCRWKCWIVDRCFAIGFAFWDELVGVCYDNKDDDLKENGRGL